MSDCQYILINEDDTMISHHGYVLTVYQIIVCIINRVGFCPSKTCFEWGSGQTLVKTGQNQTVS